MQNLNAFLAVKQTVNNRCGNSVVRYTLIEMAWRMLRWQPDYRPLQKAPRGFGQ
jgi:hypothetical protein